ncbi:DUF4297 domain-containing protein [Nostoc ellipsosporum NOK]|nr:DUF4297 domain-containing protein [Nostoc ellipsosporum NOK]
MDCLTDYFISPKFYILLGPTLTMTAVDPLNPLNSPQREKKGAETAADYAYQYHWALYRAIQEHGVSNEYAVFVELHEDVVICNSLDQSKAEFQFNQIKTTAKKFSSKVLLNKKNNKSILGKLIASGAGKPFSSKITELNLVAVSGFSLKLKEPDLSLDKITLPDLDPVELAAIALAIKTELSIDPLPTTIQFIISDLPDKRFQDIIIGEIAKLITTLHPQSNCNAVDIYRLLIDELNRKGAVTYDFAKWPDLLKNKALTSATVTTVINQYTSIKDETKVQSELQSICTELGLHNMASRSLRQKFDRYRQTRIGNKSVFQLDLTSKLHNLITKNEAATNNDIKMLIKLVADELDDKTKSNFASEDDLKAAILCEYIMGEL